MVIASGLDVDRGRDVAALNRPEIVCALLAVPELKRRNRLRYRVREAHGQLALDPAISERFGAFVVRHKEGRQHAQA